MGSANYPNKILVVDSDKSIGQGLAVALSKHDIKVDVASDRESAIYLFNQNIYPVVMIELEFPDLPGLVLLQKFRDAAETEKSSCGAILMTGGGGRNAAQVKLLEELQNVLTVVKPIKPIPLLSLLQKSFLARNNTLKSVELYRSILNFARSKKNYEKAIELAKANQDKLGRQAVDTIVELLSEDSRYPEAMEVVDGQLQRKPGNTKLLNDKSKLLLKMGKTKDALTILEQLDKAAPKNIERINALAQLYLESQRPDDSVEKMRELINFHPEDEDMKFWFIR